MVAIFVAKIVRGKNGGEKDTSRDDRKEEREGGQQRSLVQSFLRLIVATLIAGIGCKLAVAQMEMATR